MAKLKGKTEDAACPILKQKFWTKGTSLVGKVSRVFETQPEPGKVATCYELQLSKWLEVDGELLSPSAIGKQKLEKVGVAEMTGLLMAINAAGTSHLQEGDMVEITATGQTDTGKGNPRTDFRIEIDRD